MQRVWSVGLENGEGRIERQAREANITNLEKISKRPKRKVVDTFGKVAKGPMIALQKMCPHSTHRIERDTCNQMRWSPRRTTWLWKADRIQWPPRGKCWGGRRGRDWGRWGGVERSVKGDARGAEDFKAIKHLYIIYEYYANHPITYKVWMIWSVFQEKFFPTSLSHKLDEVMTQ